MAERQGFEPWIPCGIHAFQACAFSHSAISPSGLPVKTLSQAGWATVSAGVSLIELFGHYGKSQDVALEGEA